MSGKRVRKGAPCGCGCGLFTTTAEAKYIRSHQPLTPITDRFWLKVDKTDGCWWWTGCLNSGGYGDIGLSGEHRNTRAHRLSWVIHNGDIPNGLYVLHKCDNRSCVNPDHLFLGTNQENMDDMWRKGRGSRLYGATSPNCRLSTKQVDEIRERHIAGIHPARGTGSSTSELANEFGITKTYVWQLTNHKWRNVA